jgi:hypothetical protein
MFVCVANSVASSTSNPERLRAESARPPLFSTCDLGNAVDQAAASKRAGGDVSFQPRVGANAARRFSTGNSPNTFGLPSPLSSLSSSNVFSIVIRNRLFHGTAIVAGTNAIQDRLI